MSIKTMFIPLKVDQDQHVSIYSITFSLCTFPSEEKRFFKGLYPIAY
jgi:hypothetical protein